MFKLLPQSNPTPHQLLQSAQAIFPGSEPPPYGNRVLQKSVVFCLPEVDTPSRNSPIPAVP